MAWEHNTEKKTTQAIDDSVKTDRECLSDGFAILEKNKMILEESAKELLEKETLSEGDLTKYFKSAWVDGKKGLYD